MHKIIFEYLQYHPIHAIRAVKVHAGGDELKVNFNILFSEKNRKYQGYLPGE